jgi:hypothetical protein
VSFTVFLLSNEIAHPTRLDFGRRSFARAETWGPAENPVAINTGMQRLVRDLDELPMPDAGYRMLEPPHRRRALSSRPCDPKRVADGQDNCDKYAICLDPNDENKPKCYSFPACPEVGSCPTGTEGAVCNDGIIPNKARMCLTGLCKSSLNCPSAWSCVRFASNAVVGVCSNGSNFTPCNSAVDCSSAANKCAKGSPSDYSGYCTDGKFGSFCSQGSECLNGNCSAFPNSGRLGSCF